MLINSILNQVQRHSCFVYGAAHWRQFRGRTVLEIQIQPRRASRPICSGCGQRGPGYDVLAQRRFEIVPLWGIAVFSFFTLCAGWTVSVVA